MTSRAERQEQRRAERTEALVLRLLGPVESLLREGRRWADLTVDEIIERADVPRSTFYYNFRVKDELLIAIAQPAMQEIIDSAADLYKLGPSASRAEFEGQVRRTVDVWTPHVCLIDALYEAGAVNPRAREQFRTGWSDAYQGAIDYIRAGQADGTIRPEIDPVNHAAWLTWMAERGISQLVEPVGPQQRDAVCAALADIIWSVLYGSSTQGTD